MAQLTEAGLGSKYLEAGNNAYAACMKGPHTTVADKVAYFLHSHADFIAPGRHALYESQESLNKTPEFMRPDTLKNSKNISFLAKVPYAKFLMY